MSLKVREHGDKAVRAGRVLDTLYTAHTQEDARNGVME